MSISVGRFRPIATASMGALTSDPPVPVKRTVGFVVVDMALAAAAKQRMPSSRNAVRCGSRPRHLVIYNGSTDSAVTRCSTARNQFSIIA